MFTLDELIRWDGQLLFLTYVQALPCLICVNAHDLCAHAQPFPFNGDATAQLPPFSPNALPKEPLVWLPFSIMNFNDGFLFQGLGLRLGGALLPQAFRDAHEFNEVIGDRDVSDAVAALHRVANAQAQGVGVGVNAIDEAND